jgi:AcrR family transcriptional regulator
MLNDNSVNIEPAERSYHHGDLRSALIQEGLNLLQTRSADALSLRETARNVGVSATSIYRHFPDKAALLTALAEEGFRRLAQEQTAASGESTAEAFAGMGRAYVRFAIRNPSLFRLMFASFPAQVHPDDESPVGSAAWLLRTSIAGMLGSAATRENQFTAMLRAWSLVHGLAMLILDHQVDRNAAEAMIDQIVSADSLRLEISG